MKYFYKNLSLEIPETVYYPREDSELLALVLEQQNLHGKKALDMGCGSGLLSIVMAGKGADVTAADINEEAVKAAEKNAIANRVKIQAVKSDIFSAIRGKFDIIAFNAPYLPEDIDLDVVAKIRNEDPSGLRDTNIARQWNGGPTGREVIEKFAENANKFLKYQGKIILGISSITNEAKTLQLFESLGFHAKAVLRGKIPWEELIAIEIHGTSDKS
jgi:release factor glutamine methyltransferase